MIFSVKSIEYCYLKADLIRRFIIINAYSEDSFCMFHFSASPRNCLAHSYILQRTSTSFDTVLYSCTYSELDVSGTRCCQWLLVHNNLSTLNNRLKEFIVVFYFSVRTKFIYQCTAVFLLKFKVIYSSAISFVHFVFFLCLNTYLCLFLHAFFSICTLVLVAGISVFSFVLLHCQNFLYSTMNNDHTAITVSTRTSSKALHVSRQDLLHYAMKTTR